MELKSIELATGVTLEYIEHGGQRNGDPVIFIHGWLDSWFSWTRVIELSPARYHSYAPTLRGHGLSSKPADGYHMADYAADLIAFMDQLDIPRASLVGHSMGSIIAQRLAIDHPDRVDRIVLVGSAASLGGNPALREVIELVAGLSDPIDPALVKEFVHSLFVQTCDNMFMDRLVREELLVPENTWSKGLDGLLEVDYRDELGRIAAPTLVIWSDGDQLFSRRDQQDLIDGIPHSTLVTWENVGHAMHWEDAQRAASDIKRFLASGA